MTAKMPARSGNLTVDDFRRLGVRPGEIRPGVIRLAAARNSRPPASALLRNQDDQSWRQLSRVATSTYRLLDPRLRQDAHHRAFVGRILPGVIEAATPASFISTGPGSDLPPRSERSLFQMPTSDAKGGMHGAIADEVDSWEHRISRDAFNHHSTLVRLKRRRTRSRRHVQWAAFLVAACSILATILVCRQVVDRVQRRDGQPNGSIAVAGKPAPPPSAPGPLSPDAVSGQSQSASGVAATLPAPDPFQGHDPFQDTTGAAELADERLSARQQDLAASAKAIDTPPRRFTTSGGSGSMLEAALGSSASRSVENLSPAIPPSTSSTPPALATNQVAAGNLTRKVTPENTAKDNDAATRRKFRLPHPADVAMARRKVLDDTLTVTLGDSDVAVTPLGRLRVRDQLRRTFASLDPPSTDHFATATLLSDLRWLDHQDASRAIREITRTFENYQIDPASILADSFQNAADYVTLPEDLESFAIAGMQLTDHLIGQGLFDPARLILQVIQQRSDRIGVLDLAGEDLGKLVADYHKSVRYAERLSRTAARILQLHGDMDLIPDDISGGSSLGRYYCLVLGRWDEGLRFLAQVSNPRIASLSRSEIQLRETDSSYSDTAMWIEVADRWDAGADDFSGRSATQVRLHALQLLGHASHQADLAFGRIDQGDDGGGIDAASMSLRQQIDDLAAGLAAKLPIHCRGLDVFQSSQRDADEAADDESIQRSSTESTGPGLTRVSTDGVPLEPAAVPVQPNVLTGRIQIAGQDVGVRLDYQPGTAITITMLQAIEKQLRRSLDGAVIELAGIVRRDQAGPIEIGLLPEETVGDAPIRWQSVLVDGVTVSVRSNSGGSLSSGSLQRNLAAGDHTLAWTIQLDQMPPPAAVEAGGGPLLLLSLRDRDSSKPLTVTADPQVDSATASGDLRVSIVQPNAGQNTDR